MAVDFFFVLSGFVIGYADDDRWRTMSTMEFFQRRLIRLHPMIALCIAYLCLRFYDIPLRNWLSQRLRRKGLQPALA